MKTLRHALKDAHEKRTALGHFNVGNLEMFQGVVAAAKEAKLPVIVGVSEGERDFFGVKNIVALVAAARRDGVEVFLNADHTYSVDRVKEAVDAGFDAVIFDGAKLPLAENILATRECVEYARMKNPDILIEGEVGYIGEGSKVIETIPEGAAITEEAMTKPEEAERFVKETGVDLLAPAVGNIHGMLARAKNPDLSISRIEKIARATGIPLVLHGGSGISDDDFRKAILAGMHIVHISTELRVAYREALEEALNEKKDELAPYKYGKKGVEAVRAIVERRLKLFDGRN